MFGCLDVLILFFMVECNDEKDIKTHACFSMFFFFLQVPVLETIGGVGE
jgi:hypothetical protein